MKKIITIILLMTMMLTLQACKPTNTSSELDFVDKFIFFEVGDGYDNSEYVELSKEQQIKLKEILDTDSWKPFDEVLEIGFSTTLILKNESNDVIYFNTYNDETLILIKFSDKAKESIMFTTSVDLIEELTFFQQEITK